MEDSNRLVTVDVETSYVSPWGEPGRKSTAVKLLLELENYDIAGDGAVIRRNMVKEVALIPQLRHTNMTIFGAAVYIYYNNKENPYDIPNYIVDTLIERFNKLEKSNKTEEDMEDSLNAEELHLAVKANLTRYIYIIKEFLEKDHVAMDDDELDDYEETLDLGEMDEFNNYVDPDFEFDPIEM